MMSFFGISTCDWLIPDALWEKSWESIRKSSEKTLEMTAMACYFVSQKKVAR